MQRAVGGLCTSVTWPGHVGHSPVSRWGMGGLWWTYLGQAFDHFDLSVVPMGSCSYVRGKPLDVRQGVTARFTQKVLARKRLVSIHLPSRYRRRTQGVPPRHRDHFLTSENLLTRLVFVLCNVNRLPRVIALPGNGPIFDSGGLPSFSVSCTKGVINITLAARNRYNLSVRLRHTAHKFRDPRTPSGRAFSDGRSL